MGPILAIPEDVRIFVQWYTRAQVWRFPANKNIRQQFRRAIRIIRRANPDLWPFIVAYDEWKLAEWRKLSSATTEGQHPVEA